MKSGDQWGNKRGVSPARGGEPLELKISKTFPEKVTDCRSATFTRRPLSWLVEPNQYKAVIKDLVSTALTISGDRPWNALFLAVLSAILPAPDEPLSANFCSERF